MLMPFRRLDNLVHFTLLQFIHLYKKNDIHYIQLEYMKIYQKTLMLSHT